MPLWNPGRQADQWLKTIDRVGKDRLGPDPGDARDRHVYGIRTRAIYHECLKRQAEWARRTHKCTLDRLTPGQARQYLTERAHHVGAKRLSQERCALAVLPQIRPHQRWLRTVVQPRRDQDNKVVQGRLATSVRRLDQTTLNGLLDSLSERDAHAAIVARNGGLRMSELLTLRRLDERAPSERQAWDHRRFQNYRDPVFYTVQGKGGLIRQVAFERRDAERYIEPYRLPDETTRVVKDRGVPRVVRYTLAGGKKLSEHFTSASLYSTGESLGAHSLRHTYAHEQFQAFQAAGCSEAQALVFTSQLLGHFRPEITRTYLRGS